MERSKINIWQIVRQTANNGRLGIVVISLVFKTMLQNQNILLGVTGGIAAYKTPDLVRKLKAQGANEAGRTAGRTARAAALGGLYGGSSSAKKGAKVGLGASILTSGASINIPAGTLVETNLRNPLTLPL